eukprot:7716467-Prorocentrum_lima.AAC.1
MATLRGYIFDGNRNLVLKPAVGLSTAAASVLSMLDVMEASGLATATGAIGKTGGPALATRLTG